MTYIEKAIIYSTKKMTLKIAYKSVFGIVVVVVVVVWKNIHLVKTVVKIEIEQKII